MDELDGIHEAVSGEGGGGGGVARRYWHHELDAWRAGDLGWMGSVPNHVDVSEKEAAYSINIPAGQEPEVGMVNWQGVEPMP
jgi:hypothetical protein